MLYTIENEFLAITAHEHGGELHSIKSKINKTDYLWNGDPSYWKYHAPVLFPIVGKVKNGQYTVEGKIYELPQHGLARISKFDLLEKTGNSISFKLKYTADSLKVYPYKFSLIIKYTLEKNLVKTTYLVKNLDNKKINFLIGAHPAYMCPINKNETLEDYYFEFEENENAELMLLNTSLGLFNHQTRNFLENENKIHITKELFADDALVFDCNKINSKKISLKSNKSNLGLEFDFSDFTYLGLWAPATGAPFICIEPWYGHADYEDFNDEFSKKEGIITLEENKTFECSYSVKILG